MSIRNFVIVDGDDAGGDEAHGVIDVSIVREALERATRVAAHKTDVNAPGDDRFTMRFAIQELSEALQAVCGQLVQLEAGVRSGRISVATVDNSHGGAAASA